MHDLTYEQLEAHLLLAELRSYGGDLYVGEDGKSLYYTQRVKIPVRLHQELCDKMQEIIAVLSGKQNRYRTFQRCNSLVEQLYGPSALVRAIEGQALERTPKPTWYVVQDELQPGENSVEVILPAAVQKGCKLTVIVEPRE